MTHPEPSRINDNRGNRDHADRSPSDYCIFKVHNELRKVNKEEYEPYIIAIGPYHHGKEVLKSMEVNKKLYLQNLVDRKKHNKEGYIPKIEEEVFEKVRKCYAEIEPLHGYGPDELTLDAGFIVELMWKSSNHNLQKANDPIFKNKCILSSLKRDLLLFENQIPFFVICMLFDMTKDEGSNETFTQLARDFFRVFLPGVGREDTDITDNPKRFKHLLGLVHGSWLPSFTKVQSHKEEERIGGSSKGILNQIGPVKLPILDESKNFDARVQNSKCIHCVTELTVAGIKFKMGKGNMFDIRFEKGTFIIPPLIVNSRTESLFRNLIAHEQYRQGTDHHFVTDYVKIMGCLIKSPEDVGILRRQHIINYDSGDDEKVFIMFNKMTVSVESSGELFHYKDIFNQVDKYYLKRGHKWMATLRGSYCSSPWTIVSVLAATVLLSLTLTQTVFTVIS